MKEELTREVLEAMARCSKTSDCNRCGAYEFCKGRKWLFRFENFAAALLEEMDKPKVWSGAPEWANNARVRWSNPNYPVGKDEIYSTLYTRELPKSRARQIAEEIEEALNSSDRYKPEVKTIESVLKKYAEELEGEE